MKAKRKFNMDGRQTVKPILRRSKDVFRVSKTLYFVMIVLASLVIAACDNDNKNTDSEVLAKVGSSDITLKQVDSVIKQQVGTGGPAFTSTELAAARLSVLDNLIQEEALFQMAQKGDNLVPDDNKVNQEIQKTKQDAGLTEEKYQESLKEAGLTEADVKDRIKRQLAINALRDREKARVTAPTDAEIEKYFNDNREQFVAARGVDLSIIVADPKNNGAIDDALSEAQAEQKINAIYGQLKSGADFATVASQRSEHQSAMRQGMAGFATEDQLREQLPTHPEVVQRLMTMTPGQYTEPIKEAGSWVIFKVNNRQDQTQNLTLDNPAVRKRILDGITQTRQAVLLDALRQKAVAEAGIKNYLAERIVDNPKTIVEVQPSALLKQTSEGGQQPQQPQPRFENENRAAQPAAANANGAGSRNANRAPATSNANR
ncbi:MAG TPA: SurA N-terminal domain-containing protein [Blastocatellia bacterium]|nr:SurA N-terminal domain-containing protein [Blastocatellia bacterium]